METTPPTPPALESALTSPAPLPLGYASQPAEQYTLYSPQAVALATFFGAPLAGTAIMVLNYRCLGRPASAWKAIVIGAIATAALIGLAFALPASTPSYLLSIVTLVIMLQVAKSLQGQAFERHKVAGGKIASLWKATGIGILGLVLVLAVILAAVLATTPSTGVRLAVGNSEIRYAGAATQADAQALGKALTDIGYFGANHATTVLLRKDASGATIQFVVNEDAGKKDSTLVTFTQITESIAPAIGGKPLTLKLLSPELKELKSKKME